MLDKTTQKRTDALDGRVKELPILSRKPFLVRASKPRHVMNVPWPWQGQANQTLREISTKAAHKQRNITIENHRQCSVGGAKVRVEHRKFVANSNAKSSTLGFIQKWHIAEDKFVAPLRNLRLLTLLSKGDKLLVQLARQQLFHRNARSHNNGDRFLLRANLLLLF